MVQKKKKAKKGPQWADHLTHKAKAENYPARSVYKLMEIQKKFTVLKRGDTVLDLGCAPGSWLIYVAKTVGNTGSAHGIDLKAVEVALPGNAVAHVGDIFDMDENISAPDGKKYNAVLSDMAPSTTGRKDIDAARSQGLCEAALAKALELLDPGGHFVCKIFQGGDFKVFEKEVQQHFKQHKIFKPESCRKSSKEIYIIGLNKK